MLTLFFILTSITFIWLSEKTFLRTWFTSLSWQQPIFFSLIVCFTPTLRAVTGEGKKPLPLFDLQWPTCTLCAINQVLFLCNINNPTQRRMNEHQVKVSKCHCPSVWPLVTFVLQRRICAVLLIVRPPACLSVCRLTYIIMTWTRGSVFSDHLHLLPEAQQHGDLCVTLTMLKEKWCAESNHFFL